MLRQVSRVPFSTTRVSSRASQHSWMWARMRSSPACTKWVAERVAMEGCPGFDADAAYAAMDFLLDALGEIAAGVFATTATLLNLACDVVFVDTTSTYWELDGADELAELADDVDDDGWPGQWKRRPARSGTPRTSGPICRRW